MAIPPLIGITAECIKHPPGSMSQGIQDAYVRAVENSGALPVLLPILSKGPSTAALFAMLDGVVFSGGGDIDPSQYMEAPACQLRAVDHARDRFERELIQLALETHKPFLGICRGLQMLNVVCGGSLIQDISSEVESELQHDTILGEDGEHQISLTAGSQLSKLLKLEQIQVNSAHHQAIRTLGQGLRCSAKAEDGILEAIEVINHPFGIAVQWHPERIFQRPASQTIFQALTIAAGRE